MLNPLAPARRTLAAILLASPLMASAHTTLLYTEEPTLARSQDIEFSIVFTHATEGGPTLPVEIDSFTLTSGREFFTEDADISDSLERADWINDYASEEGTRVAAYKATIERDQIRSLGDYQFSLVTKPYWDENDGLYVQQFVKTMVNVGGAQTNWYTMLGLPAEIHALKKPYANYVGDVFSGVVYSDGMAVPYARIEVDYINYAMDTEARGFGDDPIIKHSHPSYNYISIMTNADGEFHFGIPHAGWWAIAALGVGPEYSLNGEYLSQDAILWLYAQDVPTGDGE